MKNVGIREVEQSDDAPTRSRVARLLLENGPATAAELAARLELTPAGVRRHLDHLLADGSVDMRPRRSQGTRGRGRPAREFVISDRGREEFAHSYDELATSALGYIAKIGGPDAVKRFADEHLTQLEARLAALLADVPAPDKADALAAALSAEGYAASTSSTQHGIQICQHHCPVSGVAAQFAELCEAEAEMFSRLLNTHVQRLATIGHGDGVCTTHLPVPAVKPTE